MVGKAEQARWSGLGRSIGRVALAAGVTVSLVGASVVPTVARAEGTGTITIATGIYKNDVTYLGYRIFDATVGSDQTVSDVKWASEDVREAVEGAIKAYDSTYAGTTAQEAALWMRKHVTAEGTRTFADANDAASKIAKAVAGKASTITAKPGETTTLAQGYWLFVTDESTTKDQQRYAGTSPIFTVVGSNPVRVLDKAQTPTVEKRVVSEDGKEKLASDFQVGQSMQFRLSGSTPGNIASYDKYYYEFEDTLPKGLDYEGNAKVTLLAADADDLEDGTDVTGRFKIESSKSEDGSTKLTLECEDVKQIEGVGANCYFVVSYNAKLNSDAATGGEGNSNKVVLRYSNNPLGEGRGYTTTNEARAYTFRLQIAKVDATTKKSLEGAKFTICATEPDDEASKGKYVQQDGSLGSTAHEFSTDANGLIEVPGVDQGTYTVHEAEPPKDETGTYEKVDDFTVTIKATYGAGEDDGVDPYDIKEFTGSCKGSGIQAGIDADGNGVIDDDLDEAVADGRTGVVRVTVSDKISTGLPVTGQQGIVCAVAGGLVIVTASAVALGRRHRDSELRA